MSITQATAIIASSRAEQVAVYGRTGAAADRPLPTLIVCPATLIAHWPFEIQKCVGPDQLRVMQYTGGPQVCRSISM